MAQNNAETELNDSRNPWAIGTLLIAFLGFIAILTVLLTGMRRVEPLLLWAIIVGLMTLFVIALGWGANGKWFGILIDTRNRVSLSRLQITLWTLLSLSAYLALAIPRSMPQALVTPSAEAVEMCQSNYVRIVAGVEDPEAFQEAAPEQAARVIREAEEECTPQALRITFPPELLVALGISTASFAGSTLVQSVKRNRRTLGLITELQRKMEEAEEEFKKKEESFNQLRDQLGNANSVKAQAERRIKESDLSEEEKTQAEIEAANAQQQIENITSRFLQAQTDYRNAKEAFEEAKKEWEMEDKKKEGLLKVNDTPKAAQLGDLFQGDEIGNYNLIDVSKVQMFFFTIAIIVAYAIAVGTMLQDPLTVFGPLGVDLPPFSSSLNAMLGISHAGYLTVKSVDHTKTS